MNGKENNLLRSQCGIMTEGGRLNRGHFVETFKFKINLFAGAIFLGRSSTYEAIELADLAVIQKG